MIERKRAEYYDLLETCQRGTGDITQWVIWFLDAVREAGQEAGQHFQRLSQRTSPLENTDLSTAVLSFDLFRVNQQRRLRAHHEST